METLIPLIIIGLFVYSIFSRKGGIGGGGHGTPESRRYQNGPAVKSADIHRVHIIDLGPDEYTVLSTVRIDNIEAAGRK